MILQHILFTAMREEMLKQLPQSLQGERKALENKISMVTKNIENALDQFQVIGHQQFEYFVSAS